MEISKAPPSARSRRPEHNQLEGTHIMPTTAIESDPRGFPARPSLHHLGDGQSFFPPL